ncbi:hypothetical protein [Actinoplanes sp. NPDC089786]|uniref:hypothetical protein n=1 Tax=Actinoplanes sp. NPDC089786 TaxID=3155185 RepID=UPI00343E75F4
MTRQSTLPGLREQARHALLLLGVPAPARLVVDVHAAFFDGDLSVPALAALMRDDERFAAGLDPSSGLDSGLFARAESPAGPDGSATAVPTHSAGFDGGTVLRPYLICPALHPDLAPARGTVTLSTWSLDERLITPAVARAHALVATARIAEFAAARPGASARELLQRLALEVPGGPEALDLAEAARAALDDPALAAAAAAEGPARTAALARTDHLDEHRRLFGVPSVPHQRGGA